MGSNNGGSFVTFSFVVNFHRFVPQTIFRLGVHLNPQNQQEIDRNDKINKIDEINENS